jgi:hypothetical protein
VIYYYRWTKAEGDYPEGDPELHDFVGTMLFNGKFFIYEIWEYNKLNVVVGIEKKYSLAEDHLLLGTDHSAELIGKLGYNWAVEENTKWKGIYLARIVLQ